jgi:hypothetical protein
LKLAYESYQQNGKRAPTIAFSQATVGNRVRAVYMSTVHVVMIPKEARQQELEASIRAQQTLVLQRTQAGAEDDDYVIVKDRSSSPAEQ